MNVQQTGSWEQEPQDCAAYLFALLLHVPLLYADAVHWTGDLFAQILSRRPFVQSGAVGSHGAQHASRMASAVGAVSVEAVIQFAAVIGGGRLLCVQGFGIARGETEAARLETEIVGLLWTL